jgi:hypothetical protein
MMTFQFVEIFIFIACFHGSEQFSLQFLAASGLILFLTGICGLLFGLFCSIVMKTVLSAYVISQGSIYPISFISGE